MEFGEKGGGIGKETSKTNEVTIDTTDPPGMRA